MEQKYTKTTVKQRIASVLIAIILLGGTLITYVFLIANKGDSPQAASERQEKLASEKRQMRIVNGVKKLSDKYFPEMIKHKSNTSFNIAEANSAGVKKRDILVGTGRELTAEDVNYYAYYIGFCPDETIFDSSFDSKDTPTRLTQPISGSGLIAGWTEGVTGMKLGGVREITIPGELAYGDKREICGSKNTPLRFVVLPIDTKEFIEAIDSDN